MKASDFLGTFKAEPSQKDSEELKDAQRQTPTLLNLPASKAAKRIRKRWDRFSDYMERVRVQLKVNLLRWEGNPWAQVDPTDERKVHLPTLDVQRRLPPTRNRIPRACDRYTAQVLADEPVMEGVPASHEDEDRDAAEAASHILAGEWERARLKNKVRRAVDLSTIYRSGFILAEWDPTDGGKVPAQKYLPTLDGRGRETRELKYVDAEGNEVATAEEAAEIWQGNLRFKIGTPLNVRWSGSQYAHAATEAMWGELLTLRDVYATWPKLRSAKLSSLLADVPREAQEWLQDLRGESDAPTADVAKDDLELSGDDLMDGGKESLLDQKALVLRYWHKATRQYPKGVYLCTVGRELAHRGPSRWGVIPVAQFKCLDHPTDKLGRALVDVLRDPQELMDFVDTQILRWLASLRRRYFLPIGSVVKQKELLDPTASVIHYQGNQPPVPEQAGELPSSLVQFVDRFKQDFDDNLGVHEVSQGKHVPGVQSGRHAEALRTGDETMLGATREQVEEGLVALGRTILAAVKKEWTTPRRIRYLRSDRTYVEKHFRGADIGSTQDVILKKGTLLMLSPAQKSELIYAYAEMGFIPPDELPKLAPILDSAGVSLTEDAHYIRARRQVEEFLDGPPPALMQQYQLVQQASARIQQHIDFTNQLTDGLPADQLGQLDTRLALLEQEAQQHEMAWQAELQKYAPFFDVTEDDPQIALIHYKEKAAALARKKAEGLPEWWVGPFREHVSQLGMASGRIPMPMQPGMVPPEEGGEPAEAAPPMQ